MLSHTIIPPVKLVEILDHVKRKLMEHFKEHELAMTANHQYYDLPQESAGFTNSNLCKPLPTTNTVTVQFSNSLCVR